MKHTLKMLLTMGLAAVFLLCGLLFFNRQSPALHVENGDLLSLSADACFRLEGNWSREEQPGGVMYRLRFYADPDAGLGLYLGSMVNRFHLNGVQPFDEGASFALIPLTEETEYCLEFFHSGNIRIDVPPYSVYAGPLDRLNIFSYQNFALSFVVLGVTILSLCYSLSLYFFKPTEKYLLILSFFCLWCFLVSFSKISADFYGENAVHFSRLPNIFGDLYRDSYLNHIYRKGTTAVVVCYLFGIFLPVKIRRLHVAWCLLLAMLLPLPFVDGENYRFFSYAYIPLLVSLTEILLLLRRGGENSLCFCFALGSGAATGYRIFMALADFELCSHGTADLFYKNYSIVHIFYIVMFVFAISRKFALRFGESERLGRELQSIRGELEEKVRLRTCDLEESYSALKKEKEQSDSFLSSILHNIKTPLFSLMGHCDMLAMEEKPEKKRGYLNTIHNNIHYIKTMVENLSTAFHMEREGDLFRIQRFAIQSLLRDVEAITLGRCRFVQTELLFDLPPDPIYVRGDPFYLQQALQNVVDNALRHCGDAGRLEIFTSLEAEGRELAIHVRDNGPGIPQEELPQIFDRYYSRHSGARSMGLGLPIAREILEKQQGHIRVETVSGKGSTFILSIPVEKEQEERDL